MLKRIPIICAILILAAAGHAAVITKVDADKPIVGEIVTMTPDELHLSSEGAAVNVRTVDLVSVALFEPKRPEETQCVRLRNGDAIYARVIGGGEAAETLLARSASLGELSLRLSDIESLQFDGDDAQRSPAASEKDQVILRNGDSLVGVLVRFGKEMLTFDCSLGKVDVPFNRIRSVHFAALGQPYQEPGTLLFQITCGDASTLIGSDAKWTGREFSMRSTLGTERKLAADQVAAIEIKNGRIVYLSDMQPAEVKETPMFDERPWGWQRDRSVSGTPLVMAGKSYRKGLGVHSRSEMTYDLGGKFQKFMTDIGIDDAVDGGNIDVRVLVDGRPVVPAEGVRQVSKKTGPLAIEVSVAGASKLTLVVDFGAELHVNDHADWANARLLR